MKPTDFSLGGFRRWAVGGCIGLLLAQCVIARQFVDLTVNIETEHFHYRHGGQFSVEGAIEFPASTTFSRTLRCVVGTNSWMIEGGPGVIIKNGQITIWFTGTNIIEHTLITSVPDRNEKAVQAAFFTSFPPVGHRSTRVWKSKDGNPGRPGGVADLLQSVEKTCWLAFCSGPFLARPGRHIPVPNDLWKEYVAAADEFADQTAVFKDGLGLPERIKEFAKTNQVILEYEVRASTNVLGWNFPLEFEATQYNPSGTSGWKVLSNTKGRVTAIGVGSKPEIPADVFKYR